MDVFQPFKNIKTILSWELHDNRRWAGLPLGGQGVNPWPRWLRCSDYQENGGPPRHPNSWDYVSLHGKREFVNGIKFRILGWGGYFRLSRDKCPYEGKRGRHPSKQGVGGGGKTMEVDMGLLALRMKRP